MPVDPATLHVLHYPAAVLRKKAAPVLEVTDEVRAVARRMIELMKEHDGIGLAAPQVGLSWRLFVTYVPENKERSPRQTPPTADERVMVYINPVLSNPVGAPEPYEEGCLSLPDIRGDVLRPPVVTITATDIEGNTFTKTAGGLLARCMQHEFDHLEGVLILDRMMQIFRIKNRAKVRELERDA